MLSCKEPGGLFANCSQGNFPLWGNSGLPRRCEADAREEETQAERSSREERSGGHAGFAATRARVLPRETQRRETLLAEVIWEARALFIPLPPSPREVPRRGGRSYLIFSPATQKHGLARGSFRESGPLGEGDFCLQMFRPFGGAAVRRVRSGGAQGRFSFVRQKNFTLGGGELLLTG